MSSKRENDHSEGVSSSVHIPEDSQLPPPVLEANTTTVAETSQPTESSSESPANYLLVTDPTDSQSNNEDLKFHNFKTIGLFSRNENKSYSEEEKHLLKIPKLLSEVPDLRGIELAGPEFDEALKITPTPFQDEEGHQIIHKWLIDTNYFKKVQEKVYKKPDFICFGTSFAFPMTINLLTKTSRKIIYAAKFMDSIFIWRTSKFKPKPRSKEEAERNLKTLYSHKKFKSLVTDSDEQHGSVRQSIQDSNEDFVIQEVTFGTHQLLVASKISAYDKNVAGDQECNWINFKHFTNVDPNSKNANQQKSILKEKYLRCWVDCAACGINRVFVGVTERGNNRKITDQRIMNIDEVLKESGKNKEAVQQAYEFQNRFLNWIKSHFKENNPNVVKLFSWNKSNPHRVEYSNTDEKYLSVEGMIPFPDVTVDPITTEEEFVPDLKKRKTCDLEV